MTRLRTALCATLIALPVAAGAITLSQHPALVHVGSTGHSHSHTMEEGEAVLGPLTITKAMARASIGRSPVSAIYFTVTTSEGSDRLISATSPAAETVELHTTKMENDVMKMQKVEAIPVSPEAPAMLEPGGLHVMLIGLVEPLKEGTMVPLSLTFETAGDVDLEVPVVKLKPTHKHGS